LFNSELHFLSHICDSDTIPTPGHRCVLMFFLLVHGVVLTYSGSHACILSFRWHEFM